MPLGYQTFYHSNNEQNKTICTSIMLKKFQNLFLAVKNELAKNIPMLHDQFSCH